MAALLFIFALLLPAFALAGYVAAGNEVVRASRDPEFIPQVLREAHITPQTACEVTWRAELGIGAHLSMIGLAFGGRELRLWRLRRRKLPQLTHAAGQVMPILAGATVLETLRAQRHPARLGLRRPRALHHLPHAGDQGPRAACRRRTAWKPRRWRASARRRACGSPARSARPPTSPSCRCSRADAGAADGSLRGGLEGSERLITVVFVDMRGSTTLGESQAALRRAVHSQPFFSEMTKALVATNGHYSQFTGDGLMALYGLNAADPAIGPARCAARRARDARCASSSSITSSGASSPQPLRIGIGIHYGEAIVGAMGPPRSQIITAIGDTVNTCARLESLTKDYDCVVIVSQRRPPNWPASTPPGITLQRHR